MKIGCLGPAGTYTHEAAEAYNENVNDCIIQYASIGDVILAVDSGEIDKGIVPVENSIEGSVNVTIDMLVHEVDLFIEREIILPIRHCLITRQETSPESISLILSHPQGLAQCRRYIRSNFPGVEQRSVLSTAEAVSQVCRSSQPWAAIASRNAALRFGMKIVADDIQDHRNNCTRFVSIAKQYGCPCGRDKTSIAFTVDDRPGGLLKALQVFSQHNINLTRIESRPMRTLLGQYLFLVDMEGHCEDERISKILGIICKESKFYKFLGSFPAGMYIKEEMQA